LPRSWALEKLVLFTQRSRSAHGSVLLEEMSVTALADPIRWTRDELCALSLFASADLDVLEPLLRDCAVRELATNEVLVEAGSIRKQLGLVLSG
jgi:hypothetical protein